MAARKRMSLVHVDAPDSPTLEAQYNPDEMEINLQALLNRHDVPLLGYQPIQYKGTGNVVAKFKLVFNGTQLPPAMMRNVWAFFFSGMYGVSDDSGQFTLQGPGRVLFVWPGWIRLFCVQPSLKIKVLKFSTEGDPLPIYFTVDVELEERRDLNLDYESGSDLISLPT